MINEQAIRAYLRQKYPGVSHIRIRRLGAGVQGAGFLLELMTEEGVKTYVIKKLLGKGLGHDYPSDRAAVFLVDLETFGSLPKHVKAIDVLAELSDGSVKSVGGGIEYYLLMEKADGRDYFHDLREFEAKDHLEPLDARKIGAMAAYLAGIHGTKKESRGLYWRKVRDTIGHGECLMGVLDTYPDGIMSYADMAEIEKACVDWRSRLKSKTHRLCQIHGDFHPGNIWFSTTGDKSAFMLLDRSRGPWGDAADDVTALTINYVFFSIRSYGTLRGAYREGLELFFEEYISLTNDPELLDVVALFYAFRGIVVANPLFYPEVTQGQRQKIIRFVRNVLASERFDVDVVDDALR